MIEIIVFALFAYRRMHCQLAFGMIKLLLFENIFYVKKIFFCYFMACWINKLRILSTKNN